jgi:transcriptional regulator with XRE-family HTH domain
MPAKSPPPTEKALAQLLALGEQIRARRKALGVSATAAAEAAGLSRVTLHRIEKGEPAVTIGAWANVLAALDMDWGVHSADEAAHAARPTELNDWVPVRVRLSDYPQLKSLAWQVHGTDTLTPTEAIDIYTRNARHLDTQAMTAPEQALLTALRTAFGQDDHV